MVEIDKEYMFQGPDGKASLLDMFDDRRQLLVWHFMFAPGVEGWASADCPICSLVIDNVGNLSHLHARNTSLALVSRAPIENISAYKQRMGWTIPWYSSDGSDFNYDFHVTMDPNVAPVEYNYKLRSKFPAGVEWPMEGHGVSAFLRRADRVFHTYSSYARGGDLVIGTYNWLDLTALGRQEDWELPHGRSDGSPFSWLHRHDEYDT
jgi:predicted dithiol-disulfide oxidoreductase (DUF899 family)